jgi:photosystem II stability/assembly factor-like uncharacterized protein
VVLVTWDPLPDLTYWIFYQQGTDVSAAGTGSTAIKNAVTPRAVTGLLNGTQYAFVMNATNNDSAAGPSSPVVRPNKTRLAGDIWTIGTTPIALPPPSTPQDLNALALSGTRFVTVGNAGAIFYGDFNYGSSNPLGVTAWTPPLTPPTTADLSAAIFNGTFVALGTNGAVLTSADGFTWTVQHAVSSVGVTGLNGLAFGFIQGVPSYIAVGNGGQIYTTSNLAQEWTLDTSANTTSDLTSITLLNGFLFVTGANGTLLLNRGSGAGWEAQPTGMTSTLRSVTFMPNALPAAVHYAAVGDAGAVVTATAIPAAGPATWTSIVVPGLPTLRSVTVGGATGLRFLAVGPGGAAFFSDDGQTWTPASQPPASDLSSVLFLVGQYLAVGSAGSNAVSH